MTEHGLEPEECSVFRVTDTPVSGRTQSQHEVDTRRRAAAARAIDEAEARRNAKTLLNQHFAEVGGPKGVDPIRHGDWERNGIARDF